MLTLLASGPGAVDFRAAGVLDLAHAGNGHDHDVHLRACFAAGELVERLRHDGLVVHFTAALHLEGEQQLGVPLAHVGADLAGRNAQDAGVAGLGFDQAPGLLADGLDVGGEFGARVDLADGQRDFGDAEIHDVVLQRDLAGGRGGLHHDVLLEDRRGEFRRGAGFLGVFVFCRKDAAPNAGFDGVQAGGQADSGQGQ